jgi:8-oxo-dGTP pyrophosphatase MutT (NUDIX family)
MRPVRFDEELRRRLQVNLDGFEVQSADGGELVNAAVCVAIVGGDDGEASFVLILRASSSGDHRGQFALPGGRVDAGETTTQAALRELREEVSITCDEEAVLGRLDDYRTRSGYRISPIVVWAGAETPVGASPEVTETFRIGLSELLRSDGPQFVRIPESERPVIQIPIGESHIYAPTGAILHQFAEVGLRGRPTRVAHYEQPVFAWK